MNKIFLPGLLLLLSACGGSDKASIFGGHLGYHNGQELPLAKIDGKQPPNQVQFDGAKHDFIVKDMTNDKGILRHQEKYRGRTIVREALPGLEYTRVGMMVVDNSQARDYQSRLIYQGIKPDELPSSGTAHYKGTAVVMSTQQASNADEMNMDVDFSNKTVKGRLNNRIRYGTGTNEELNGMDFAGAVNGNRFEATSQSTQFHGGFYGPRGQEFGGVLQDSVRKIDGYYGGHKQ